MNVMLDSYNPSLIVFTVPAHCNLTCTIAVSVSASLVVMFVAGVIITIINLKLHVHKTHDATSSPEQCKCTVDNGPDLQDVEPNLHSTNDEMSSPEHTIKLSNNVAYGNHTDLEDVEPVYDYPRYTTAAVEQLSAPLASTQPNEGPNYNSPCNLLDEVHPSSNIVYNIGQC